MRFLSLAQVAPGLRADGIGTLAVGAVHVDRRDERYAGSVNVVGETEKRRRVQILIVARNAVCPDRSACEPPRQVQQQRRGEGVRQIHSSQVSGAGLWTRGAWIRNIAEAVEAVARVPLPRVFDADQVFITEPMVDL